MIICVITGPVGCGKSTWLRNQFYSLMGDEHCPGMWEVYPDRPGKYGKGIPPRTLKSAVLHAHKRGVQYLVFEDCPGRFIEEAEALSFAEGGKFCRDLTLYLVRAA